MKKYLFLIILGFVFSCNSEDSNDCLKVEGESIEQQIELQNFNEISVYGGVKLYLTYGSSQKVILKTGKNLVNAVSFEVKANQLFIKNTTECNFFREYDVVKVFITLPSLTYLRNGSQFTVESTNVLEFENLSLVSEDANSAGDFYTNGDFKLQLNSHRLVIVSNNLSDFDLSGQVENLQIGFYSGDGRFKGENLIAQHVEFYHRGSNKIIVNPLQSLSGSIVSTGDVIAKNHPPLVEVEELYTGKLIFE